MSLEDKKMFCISEDQIADMEDGIDMDKMRAMDKHNSDIETMTLCRAGLNMYIKRFGKESNIYEKCKELIVEIDTNIKATENYLDIL